MYNSCLMFPSIYCVVYVQLIGANVELSRAYTQLQKACRLESMCPNVILLLRQLRSISVRVCAQFAGRFAGCATPRLWHLNTSHLHDFSRYSMLPPDWYIDLLGIYEQVSHIGALISSLAAVTRAHRFQVGHARYYWCLMACRRGICPTTYSASIATTNPVSGRRHPRS